MKGNIRMKNQYITLTSIILALSCFAFLPKTQALSPAPDGCYPGFTTAEGCSALSHLTSGAGNTGLGWFALFGTSTGSFNTGVGANAGTDPGIGSNNVYIGDPGFGGDENVISIGGIAASGTAYELTFIGGI